MLFLIANVLCQGPPPGSGGGGAVSGYACNPQTCQLPNCLCPSSTPPGGKKPPQFITLTFDDSINSVVLPVILNMTSNFVNPNGCPLSATFFISAQFTDYWMVSRMYSLGHEIATHTMTHQSQPNAQEISGAYQAINAFGGVPKSAITGFRFPFLNYSTPSLTSVVGTKFFKYDSSMSMNYANVKTWPYTLDNGPYTACDTGTCDLANHRFPGFWEIPMATLNNADGSLNAAMDPNPLPGTAVSSVDDIYNLYKTNFENHYNGDRLPFGIFLHAAVGVQLPNHVAALVKFQQEISAKYPDVYWISNQKLLAWMQNATDVQGALTSPQLDCLMPAVDPSNQEVCDGIDNTGNGQIDAGLVKECYYPATQNSFSTCYVCPVSYPTTGSPVPAAQGAARAFIPDAGCQNGGVWDPYKGQCVTLKRQTKKLPTNPDAPAPPGVTGSNRPNSKNDATGLSILGGFFVALLSFL
ncbi:hypothetical protein EDD86DRAFT_242261 [Gorgonomyces haynaldii]|nr:hypothetical protein EDD86DRAFT_242261 [Gorgonomyces haynaldii]